MKKVYVAIYHDGSYEGGTEIIGIFDNEEAANKQCELLKKAKEEGGRGYFDADVSPDEVRVEEYDLLKETFEVSKDWPYA